MVEEIQSQLQPILKVFKDSQNLGFLDSKDFIESFSLQIFDDSNSENKLQKIFKMVD